MHWNHILLCTIGIFSLMSVVSLASPTQQPIDLQLDGLPTTVDPVMFVKGEEIQRDSAALEYESTTTIPEVISVNTDKLNFYTGRASCKCGVTSQRIVDGTEAKISDYPFMAALIIRKKSDNKPVKGPNCGGTLINDRYVLTAAHCVVEATPSQLQIWLNEEDFASEEETTGGTRRFSVAKITVHPKYDDETQDNDLALLKLNDTIALGSDNIIPACVAMDTADLYVGKNGTVIGWGYDNEFGDVSNTLKKAEVTIISNAECNWKTGYFGKVTDNMICAGDTSKGGKDHCFGDSGGPFVLENDGQKTLIGIVSWAYGCGRPFAPGVYTRVGRYPEWILENTSDAEYCSE